MTDRLRGLEVDDQKPTFAITLRFAAVRQDWRVCIGTLQVHTQSSSRKCDKLAWSMGSRKEAGHGRASWMVL
jgi:hypothetical protein